MYVMVVKMYRYELDQDFLRIIDKVVKNKEFKKMKTFLHHRDSVYDHSLEVAYYSYLKAKKLKKINKKISIENVVYSALLHDFYLIPWRENKQKLPWKMHGFTHGKIAMEHTKEVFPEIYNKRLANAIKWHMFPLTIVPPRYIEGWIVTICDKRASLDIFKKPKELPRYVGIDLANKKSVSFLKKCYKYASSFVMNMY